MKTSVFMEYGGLQVEEKEVIAKIKEAWVSEGNKIKDIKDLNIYAKLFRGRMKTDVALFCYHNQNGMKQVLENRF